MLKVKSHKTEIRSQTSYFSIPTGDTVKVKEKSILTIFRDKSTSSKTIREDGGGAQALQM